jgi:1-acyl-sn-glycerol-3-phosphate acyltransferase
VPAATPLPNAESRVPRPRGATPPAVRLEAEGAEVDRARGATKARPDSARPSARASRSSDAASSDAASSDAASSDAASSDAASSDAASSDAASPGAASPGAASSSATTDLDRTSAHGVRSVTATSAPPAAVVASDSELASGHGVELALDSFPPPAPLPGDARSRARIEERGPLDDLSRRDTTMFEDVGGVPDDDDEAVRRAAIDDLGLDAELDARWRPRFEALYRRWFRAQAHGVANVPSEGRCLVVANHAGALPWDGLMLRTAIRLEHPAHRELRWLTEDFVSHAPVLGAFVSRIGAVPAHKQNAERLLAREELVAVFPEGVEGAAKPFRARYELQRFGHGGYVKLALRTRTPIVPTAIVGSEEAHPLLFRADAIAKRLGLPFLPVTPTFPWLGPLGLIPLPSRWVIVFGEPIELDRQDVDPADPVAVGRLNDRVRDAVHDLVQRALAMRARTF